MSVKDELAERVARSFLHCFTDTTWDNLSEERRGHYLWIAREGLAGIADSVLEFQPASEPPENWTRVIIARPSNCTHGFRTGSHWFEHDNNHEVTDVAAWAYFPDAPIVAKAIAEGVK